MFDPHDRPGRERPGFGTVRHVAASGVEGRADPAAYVAKVEQRIGHDIG